ncbi:MAG TPA: hypothetical protein VGW78_07400 [Candidatus Babeliales bacterium]|jgi:hypothetical protein|nr:hypothetical protein [Candidatus Babeliales bacterium]
MKYIIIIVCTLLCNELYAQLSEACLQIKKDLDALKQEQKTLSQSTASNKGTEFVRIQKDITEKLTQLLTYWPEIKQELDVRCMPLYDTYKQVVQSCCQDLQCEEKSKNASIETKKQLKESLEACKTKVLGTEQYALHTQCADFVQLMFEAAMQAMNKKIVDELMPYVNKYWGK